MAPPPLHPLPTREEFLATGLERVSGQTMETCTICQTISGSQHAELGSPVFLKCLLANHTFCRKCITTWLKPNENSCPNCRQEFFVKTGRPDVPDFIDPGEESSGDESMDEEEEAADEALQPLRLRVDNAFDAVGLEQPLLAPTRPAPHLLEFFEDDIQWSPSSLHQSSLAAHYWLMHDCGTIEDGGQTINANLLGSSLIVMGNVLMRLNINERRAWSDADRYTWGEILVDIWQFMSPYKGTRMYLSSLYLSLMASLLDKYYFGVAHPSPFFQEGSPLFDDFKILVNFAIFKSGTFVEWAGPLRRPLGSGTRHIKVPQECPCTASPDAVELAEAWMEDLFE
jgi:hypothetical protein